MLTILLPVKFYAFLPRPQVGLFDVIAFFKAISKKNENYVASLTTSNNNEKMEHNSIGEFPSTPSEEQSKTFIKYNGDLLEKKWLKKRDMIEKKRKAAQKYNMRSKFEHDCVELFKKTMLENDEILKNVAQIDKPELFLQEFFDNIYSLLTRILVERKDMYDAAAVTIEDALKILISSEPNAENIVNLIQQRKHYIYDNCENPALHDLVSALKESVQRYDDYLPAQQLKHCRDTGIFKSLLTREEIWNYDIYFEKEKQITINVPITI